ncbi:hypothetical protein [Brevundimonas diminuta]|uniref:hypothetical protein n=1 Tax=Brevundimonas diminuta TaxID=293 RepID=UPI0030FCE65D
MAEVVPFPQRAPCPSERVVMAHSLIDSAIAAVADERPGSGEKLLAVALSVKLTLALGSREAGDFLIHMGVRAKQSGEGGAA